MDSFKIITQASPWYILICLLVGAAYAVFLYQKKAPWNRSVNKALAGVRFLLISILCFLLMGPFIRQVQNLFEKPVYVFAIDNSESIAMTTDSVQLNQVLAKLANARQTLEEEGLHVEIQTLNQPTELDQVRFTNSSTDLSNLLSGVQSSYENRNLGGVVLVTDGIYNQGLSPAYKPFGFPIHTVALGDTTPRQDVNLKALYFNKVAYLGNKFPVVAEVQSNGYRGKTLSLALKQGSKVVATQNIKVQNDEDLQQATFLIEATNKGVQHYVVEAQTLEGEFTLKNNSRHAYVEVIDGKEKILLVALAPHPDIKAIKSALDTQENYDLYVHIPGLNPLKEDKYDLVIFHQVPDEANALSPLLDKYLQSQTAIWYITGQQTNLSRFNEINGVLKIAARSQQRDDVTPAYNQNFDRFKFDAQRQAIFQKFPPVSVPFGDYTLNNGAEVLLYHRVGSITTEKPLLAMQSAEGRKTAVLAGEGLWQWRLREYELTQKHESFDELISKLVQLLSAKEDKRKFKVYPIVSEVYDTERVVFEAEVYNDIYEKIYNQKISLSITDEEGKVNNYSFVNTEANSRFELSGLPQGVYRYTATGQVKGASEKSSGEFTVLKRDLEALNTTADHQLLRQLASQTGGVHVHNNQLDNLAEVLLSKKAKEIIRTNEAMMEIIHIQWLFWLLLALASIEWFVRKYKGSY